MEKGKRSVLSRHQTPRFPRFLPLVPLEVYFSLDRLDTVHMTYRICMRSAEVSLEVVYCSYPAKYYLAPVVDSSGSNADIWSLEM